MFKRISSLSSLLFCIVFLLISSPVKGDTIHALGYKELPLPISLTTEEHDWLEAHPTIRLAYPPGHEPTLMEGENGNLVGVLADYFELINLRLGTNISLTLVPWQEVDEWIHNKEIEGLVVATPKKVKALGLLPTQQTLSSYVVIYGQSGTDSLTFPEDLHGSRVAVLKGYNHTDIAVDQIRGTTTIVPVKSPREGLEAVHQGKVDYFIGAISNNYLISKYQLFGLGALHVFWDQPYRVGPATRSDLPELASILKKGVSLITDEEFEIIVARWTRLQRPETPVQLTPDERTWLDQHPNIKLGYTDAFEPGIIVSEDGSYRGTLVDILQLLNQRLGTNFKPSADSIPELIRQVNDKELAGVLSIHSDRADKFGWLRTKTFMNSYPTIFTKKGYDFTGPVDLAGKNIALVDNVFFSQNLVDLYGTGSKLIKVKDGREGLENVRSGKADLYIGSSRNSYLLTKYQFYDLFASFQFYDHPTPNVMAVRDDWPQLVSILDKGLDSISAAEIDSILQKWGSGSIRQQTVELTHEEQSWLKENPRIGVGVSPIPPYMFSENGKTKGYLIDMMDRLVNQVRLTADYSIKPIEENLSRAKSGELHAILGMIHSEERAGFMYFSENVMKMQMSIFARTSRSDISDAASLEDKIIASIKGYGFEPVIKKFFPNATIIQADDTEGMLRLVASGQADAAVQELYSGEYILRDNFINGVSRKGSFALPGLPLITGSEIGVSKKYPLLNSILNKAYDVLPEGEKARVWRKWFADDTAEMELVELTESEQKIIAEYPTIRFGFMIDAPWLIVDKKGHQSGILVDLGEELSRKLGIGIEIEDFKTVPDLWMASKTKAIDVVYILQPQKAAEQGLLSTDTYYQGYVAIFAQDDERVTTQDDMIGKTVSLVKGARYAEAFVEPYLGKITVVEVDKAADGMRMLGEQRVDMYVGTTTQNYLIDKYKTGGISLAYIHTKEGMPLVMGVRPDRPELVSILNKGLSSIGEKEIDDIVVRWLRIPTKIATINFSTEEQTWLAQKHTVRVRATDWPPYMIIKENGQPEGISVDYLKIISERTGVNFEYEVTSQPFADFLEGMKQHQGPDMTSLIVSAPEREQYLSFTTPYTSSPYVIFARDNDEFFLDVKSLDGKTVALPKGFIMQKFLEKDFPEIDLVLFDNSEQALLAVSTGKVDAYIGNMMVSTHIIQKRGLSNLKIVGAPPYSEQVLSIGNRNDWPELTSIMNKALASITEEEKTAIRNKYIALHYEQGINRAEVMKWVMVIIAVSAASLFLFLFWNRLLALKVKKRTAALENEITERKRVEELFSKAFHYQPNAMQIANIKTGERHTFNNAFVNLCGYSKEELLKDSAFTQSLWVDFEKQKQAVEELVKNGYIVDSSIDIRTKSGEIRHLLGSASLLDLEDDNLAIAAYVDITEQKQAQERVQQYQQRLKALASQLTLVEEKERGRLAADLHDHIGQTLAFSRIQIAKAKKYASDEKLVVILDDLSQSLLKTIQDTKELVFDLSSPLLNDLGIRAATLHWLEENFGKKHGIEFELVGAEISSPLSKDVRSILFRNIRELLANVVRHAQATKVIVSFVDNLTDLKIVVSDDGRGFDVNELKNRNGGMTKFGLFSIMERMEDMGGSMEIISEPGKGCRAILFIPLDQNYEQTDTVI